MSNSEYTTVTNVLLVRDPWASMILSGFKTWEIRSTRLGPDKLTTIAIAKSGEKGMHRIYGLVDIIGVEGSLSLRDMRENLVCHRDPADTVKLPYENTYAWVLACPRVLKTPLDYDYKPGCVIWGVGEWKFSETDFVKPDKYITMPSSDPIERGRFLQSLAEDLSYFGYDVSTGNVLGRGVTTIKMPDFEGMSAKELRETLRQGYRCIQEKNRQTHAADWNRVSALVEAKSLFTKTPLSIDKLNLVIRPVRNALDKDMHWFLRMHQNIPSSRSIGRTMDAVVYHVPHLSEADDDQNHEHVFGVIGLGSAAYTSGGRDNLFGWNDKSLESSKAKQAALRSILQINCLLLAPPYDKENFHGCKLLAMAVFSSQIVTEFEKRYGSPMLAAISTAGFGLDAFLFNRIATGALKDHIDGQLTRSLINRNQADAHALWRFPCYERDGRKEKNNYVFYREAKTGGMCFNIVSEMTKELGKIYCESSGSVNKMHAPQQALAKALHFAGINESVFRLTPRGIFVGMLSNEVIPRLSTGRTETAPALHISWDSLVNWWKHTETKRLKLRQIGVTP